MSLYVKSDFHAKNVRAQPFVRLVICLASCTFFSSATVIRGGERFVQRRDS